MRARHQTLQVIALALFLQSGFGCITGQPKTNAEPSAQALDPVVEEDEHFDDAAMPRSQVGPYQLLAPDSVDLDDETGALVVEFSLPCSNLQLDRVVVWASRTGNKAAQVGVIYAESECRSGGRQRFGRTISPGMSEYGALADIEQPKVKTMAVGEFSLVPAVSVIVEPEKHASVTYNAPCQNIAEASIITAWDPRTKTMATAVLFPHSGCQAGPAKLYQLRFGADSEEYQLLGSGEKDLSLRPMWIK